MIPYLGMIPAWGLDFRERTTAAVPRNRKNGFHRTCFFQGVKLPFFRLQRTRAAGNAAVG
jgi:hypothetical protein